MTKRVIIAIVAAACLITGVVGVVFRSPSRHPSTRSAKPAEPASSSSYVTGAPVKGASSVAVSTASFSHPQSPPSTKIRVYAEKEYNPPKTWTSPNRPRHAGQTASSQQASNSSAAAQSVVPSFLGAEFITDSNQVPPDSMGAAGPTQFLVAVNGRVRTFAKSTTTADGVMNTTLDDFFASVGGVSNGTSDPRVRYDRTTGRWFITCIDVPSSGANHILLAVSGAGTITAQTTWHFFSIPADANTFDDFDTLGVDEDALYIGANVFDATTTDFVNTTAYVVRKTSVLGSGPIVYTKFANLVNANSPVAGPFAPMGVDNFDTNTNTGYIVGVDAAVSGQLDLRRIANPGGTPSISSTISINTLETTVPADVPQPGTTAKLDAGTMPTLSNAVVRNGTLWTSHNIEVDASGAAATGGGRDGVRWYELQGLNGTPSVKQTGTIFDSVAVNPMNYWMPSVMVSGQGNTAFGFSRAGTDPALGFASAGTAGRLAGDTFGTVSLPTAYQGSATSYAPAGDPSTPKRWGDYSSTSLDPSDDMTMWTVQEYASKTDTWGVRIAKLTAPAPTITSVTQVPTGATGTTITLTGTGFYQTPSGVPNKFAATIGGGVTVNSVVSVTPTTVVLNVSTVGVSPGTQTVTVTNPDGQQATVLLVVSPPATSCPSCIDFNGDGKPDILWHNKRTGFVYTWFMNGTNYASGTAFGGSTWASAAWTPTATGDFNGDGKPDVLWHNSTTGQSVVWLMNGTQYISTSTIGWTSLPWTPVATGDFNADGKTDILWHNSVTGAVYVWLMDGTQRVSGTSLGGTSVASLPWVPVSTGDFNADGKPDIVWHNNSTGAVYIWFLDGTQHTSGSPLGGVSTASLPWKPSAAADYSGDGKPDILWHNTTTGAIYVWLMDGTQHASGTAFGGNSSASLDWSPVG